MLDSARQAGRIRLEVYPMAFIDAGSTAAANAFGCAAEAGFAPGYYAGLFGNPILRWSDDYRGRRRSGRPRRRPSRPA